MVTFTTTLPLETKVSTLCMDRITSYHTTHSLTGDKRHDQAAIDSTLASFQNDNHVGWEQQDARGGVERPSQS